MNKMSFVAIAVSVLLGASLERTDAATLNLSATIRDFNFNGTSGNGATGHIDFQNGLGDDHGFVATTLGADGKPVYIGGAGTTTTHGAAAFNQWYNNTPGVNLSTTITLTATETAPGSGIFTYSNNSYFPIDGQLLGNQG